MHYSGILVLCRPGATYECVRELSACHGVDVYTSDPSTGRVVIVLESETLAGQESGLLSLQSLPHTLAAELVYHYFGDDADAAAIDTTRNRP
jgi:nitrate reductase NapAB chaperone NapD